MVGPENLALIPQNYATTKEGKLKSPSARDQAAGVNESGPHKYTYEGELIWSIRNASILATTKLKIMQCAVAKSPKVSIRAYWIQIPSLLDSGSEVTLLRQSYFDQHLLPKIKVVMSEKAEAHQLFHLTVSNDGQLPVKLYTELDITFLGLKVLNVGILVVEDLSQVLDKKYQSKLPGIVGWNLVWLSYNAFIEKYGTSGFDSFACPEGVNTLLFSQLCVYHHSNTSKSSGLGVSTQTVSQQQEQIEPSKTNGLCKKRPTTFWWYNWTHRTGHNRLEEEYYLHPWEFGHHCAGAYHQNSA